MIKLKKNKRGFFLAETIVVVALVATVMAFVYPNVTKLYDNYKNRTRYYDQTEDLYILKVYADFFLNDINSASCSGATCIIDSSAAQTGNTFGCKNYTDGNINNINSAKELLNSTSGSSIGNIKNLYMTGYMTTLSSNDYNFNKYLRRLKKTTNDPSSYRLIGVFNTCKDGYSYKKSEDKCIQGTKKVDPESRFASIKIDNPNPNRDCPR